MSQIEDLTANFYEWENRGRGWKVFDYAVDLEPPYTPFFTHRKPREYIDDSKRPTLFERFGALFKPANSELPDKEEEQLIQPFAFEDDAPICALSISLPRGEKAKHIEMEQVLLMLGLSENHISFEITATSTKIFLQFIARFGDIHHIKNQIKGFYPNATIAESEASLWKIVPEDSCTHAIEFGLGEEFMRPLSISKHSNLDPYIPLFAVFDNLTDNDQVTLQVLFKPAINPWAESILRSVMDAHGDDFFLDAPEMVPLAKEKIASPLFGVVVRVIGTSDNDYKAIALIENLGKVLSKVTASASNQLIPLAPERSDSEHLFEDIVLRKSHRLGMLLNAKELSTLIHFPSEDVVSNKLERKILKTKSPPGIAKDHQFVLGINRHQSKEIEVSLGTSQRLKHMHIIGATGTGKSTLLINLVHNDLLLGNGLAVLDPHGDLIETVTRLIPEDRIKDTILIDPADSEFPVGLNILTAHSDIEKEILSSDLVAGFKRLSTSWGDQMNSVFANAVLAFLESDNGGTLADLRRFLIEKSYRESFLRSVKDPSIVYYWQKEFPILKSSSIGPILTRLDTFLRPKLIRNMVAQRKSIDFEDVLNNKKILFIKLSQGLIGSENSYLLGTFIVSKIHQAAMARQAKSKEDRNNFFLYIDEFQNFITPSMSAILSGARKYHLGLILAHQDMQQLMRQDSELASSVIANAGTRICFRLGDTDAKRFEDGFSYFDAKDLQSLETGEAIARIERPEFDFNLSTYLLEDTDFNSTSEAGSEVLTHSREAYGTKRSVIEALLFEAQAENKYEPKELKSEKSPNLPQEPEEPKKSSKQNHLIEVSDDKVTELVDSLTKQKEQSEHRYLQTLIKRMAESRGFKATIEALIPENQGRVDVSLERNGFRIACEVAMTTTETWEVHNIEKCLEAGYDLVVECSTNKENLSTLRKAIQTSFANDTLDKIKVLPPEDLFAYLDSLIAKEASSEKRMKGYRVKVEYSPATAEEMDRKKQSISKMMIQSKKPKNS